MMPEWMQPVYECYRAGDDWWKHLEARDAARQEEAERVARYYAEQAHAKEERERLNGK